jgi:hypothetical protein
MGKPQQEGVLLEKLDPTHSHLQWCVFVETLLYISLRKAHILCIKE